MKAIGQCCAIAAIALIASAATWWMTGPPQRVLPCDRSQLKPDEICVADVPKDQSVLWVDARSRKQWQADGMKGSILWNLDPGEDMRAFEAGAIPHILSHSMVVIYCGDKQCGTSRQIAQRIAKLDLGPKVFVLHDGWRALQQAGLIQPAK